MLLNLAKTGLIEYVSDADMTRLQEAADNELFERDSRLLQINPGLIKNSMQRLLY